MSDPISEAARRAEEAASRPPTHKELQPQRYEAWLAGVAATQQSEAEMRWEFWDWAKQVGLPMVKLGNTGVYRGWPIGVSESAGSYDTTVTNPIYVTRRGSFRYPNGVRAGGHIRHVSNVKDSAAVIAHYLRQTGYVHEWESRRQ